jgi:hypothetical protein
VALGLALQVYRFFRVSGPVQRQQSKWVVAGLLSPLLDILFYFAVVNSYSNDARAQAALQPLLFAGTLVAFRLAFSILRYRIWDIGVLVNRALFYGRLTALLALGYFGAVMLCCRRYCRPWLVRPARNW